jgi:L-threonylcarbamoyladenylate synthase
MKRTLVLRVDPQRPNREKIRIAAEFIIHGGLVAFPTETVYGLGTDALNARAVLALYKAKNRPLDNPPIVHVGDLEDVYRLVKDVPKEAEKLMKTFWPGPLTLVFKHSRIVPDVTVAGLDTIAIRMPRHNVALMLIRECDCPISAPSQPCRKAKPNFGRTRSGRFKRAHRRGSGRWTNIFRGRVDCSRLNC